ncbi:MAG: hypothetical protein V1487_02720 [bacterium]
MKSVELEELWKNGWELERLLEERFGVNKSEVEAVLEYMYRVLLSYYMPGDLGNLERSERLRMAHSVIESSQFECQLEYTPTSPNSGVRTFSNDLYLFSPRNDRDYSEMEIGGFSQLRANLIAGWLPE